MVCLHQAWPEPDTWALGHMRKLLLRQIQSFSRLRTRSIQSSNVRSLQCSGNGCGVPYPRYIYTYMLAPILNTIQIFKCDAAHRKQTQKKSGDHTNGAESRLFEKVCIGFTAALSSVIQHAVHAFFLECFLQRVI